jgi:hypothetical protein
MLEYRPLSTSERANASCWSVSEIDYLTLIGLSPLRLICYSVAHLSICDGIEFRVGVDAALFEVYPTVIASPY